MTVTTPGEPTVAAPTLDHALLEADRPAGAWSGAQAASIDPNLCDPDPNNPRGDLGDLTDLALSLVTSGMLEPVIVAPGPVEGRYTTVAGHRRIAAAIRANLTEVPALIRDDLHPGSNLSLVAQVVENLHRLPLTPLDEARAYDLLRQLGLKQADIATAVGVNQGQVSKRLALLKLPDELANTVGDTLDVATAVEVTRLPAAARKAVVEQLAKPGADPEQVVRKARADVDRAAEHQAIIDRLEAANVALVDFPGSWHWSRDREDRPLATGPDGDPQPYPGGRTIDVTYADHHGEPCHGATVSPRDDIVYVCLDPTRHGYLTAEQEADELETQRQAAEEAREAEQATLAAAEQARRDAARTAALADVKRPYMTDVAAAWLIDSLTLPTEIIDIAEPTEIVDLLLAWSDLPATTADEVDGALAIDVERLVEHHGHPRLAYMTVIARVELLVDTPGYYRQHLAGTAIIRDHYSRLTELAGYEPTPDDQTLIEPQPADTPVELPAGIEPPDGALAYYVPDSDAALDGDEARFIHDEGELDGIIAAGFAHRLVRPEPSPEPEMTDGENASDLAADADEAIAAADEANRATAAALAEASGLPDEPEFDVDPDPAEVLDPPAPPTEDGDALTPVPGERCPASRRDFNTPGDAHGIPCPLKCGALVDTTKTGKVRDHDVPEPS